MKVPVHGEKTPVSFHYERTEENTADIQGVIRARPFRLSVLQMYTYKFFAS